MLNCVAASTRIQFGLQDFPFQPAKSSAAIGCSQQAGNGLLLIYTIPSQLPQRRLHRGYADRTPAGLIPHEMRQLKLVSTYMAQFFGAPPCVNRFDYFKYDPIIHHNPTT